MFTRKDFHAFEMPIGWDRNDLLGDVFFPKLGALLGKVNALIYKVYGIDTSLRYNISSTPTSSLNPSGWDKTERRSKEYSLKSNNPDEVQVCLRGGKGDANILLKTGKITKQHFAIFGSYIGDWNHIEEGLGIILAIRFLPYVHFRYHQSVRDNFVSLAEKHNLFTLAISISERYMLWSNADSDDLECYLRWGNANGDDIDLGNAFLNDKTEIILHPLDPLNVSIDDLANHVISGVAAFPLMDCLTRMCSNEDIKHDYWNLFFDWFKSDSKKEFIDNFYVEEISTEVVWKSEQETRKNFELILKADFKKSRPDWLKSPKGGRLELDGYNEELKLAFEYQGEYHYIDLPIHHQQRTLKEVQKNDERKLKLCRKYGIDLIQVPYWEKGNITFVLEALKTLNRADINSRIML